MNDIMPIIIVLAALVGGFGLGYVVLKPRKTITLKSYQEKGEELVSKSSREAENIRGNNRSRVQEILAYMQEFEEKNKHQCEKLEKLIASKDEQLQLKTAKTLEIQKNVDEETR